MTLRTDNWFFENLSECASLAVEAAALLDAILRHFDPAYLPRQIEKMHTLEYRADRRRQDFLHHAERAFLPPLDCGDLLRISRLLDTVINRIDMAVNDLYLTDIRTVRREVLSLASLLITCCNKLKAVFLEFPLYKKSSIFNTLIHEVNQQKEHGFQEYKNITRRLYQTAGDVRELIQWERIYHDILQCLEACEATADAARDITACYR